MQITAGGRAFDVATRCLVVGVVAPGSGAAAAARRLVDDGADAVSVPGTPVPAIDRAGVPAHLVLDLPAGTTPAAAAALIALGVRAGRRVVFTDDPRAARRACDVLTAILEAEHH